MYIDMEPATKYKNRAIKLQVQRPANYLKCNKINLGDT